MILTKLLKILVNIDLYNFILYTYNKNENIYGIYIFYPVNRRYSKLGILRMRFIGKRRIVLKKKLVVLLFALSV